MSRRRKPPELYPRERAGRPPVWVILDGKKEVSTGASLDDLEAANRALETYLAETHRPPSGANRPSQLLIAEVMNAYLKEHAPTRPSKDWIADMAGDILEWWGARRSQR